MSSLVVSSSQTGLGACSHRRSARFHGTYAAVSRPRRRVSAAASRSDLVDIHHPGFALLLGEKIKMTGICQSDSHGPRSRYRSSVAAGATIDLAVQWLHQMQRKPLISAQEGHSLSAAPLTKLGNQLPAATVLAAAAGGATALADVAASGGAHLGAADEAERRVRGASLVRLQQLGRAVRLVLPDVGRRLRLPRAAVCGLAGRGRA